MDDLHRPELDPPAPKPEKPDPADDAPPSATCRLLVYTLGVAAMLGVAMREAGILRGASGKIADVFYLAAYLVALTMLYDRNMKFLGIMLLVGMICFRVGGR